MWVATTRSGTAWGCRGSRYRTHTLVVWSKDRVHVGLHGDTENQGSGHRQLVRSGQRTVSTGEGQDQGSSGMGMQRFRVTDTCSTASWNGTLCPCGQPRKLHFRNCMLTNNVTASNRHGQPCWVQAKGASMWAAVTRSGTERCIMQWTHAAGVV